MSNRRFFKNILARLDYVVQSGWCHPVEAVIFFPYRIWRWELNLKDFEVAHAFSLLAEAIPVIEEIHRKIPGDHTYLIKLAEDLVESLVKRDQENHPHTYQAPVSGLHSVHVLLGKHRIHTDVYGTNQGGVLTIDLAEELKTIRFLMRDDPEKELPERFQNLIGLSHDILTACRVFLDLLYPIWVNVEESGFIDNQEIRKRTAECMAVIGTLIPNIPYE